MKVPDNTLKAIQVFFNSALSDCYSAREIQQFFYFLCDAWLGFDKLSVRMNIDFHLSESELLLFFYGVKDLQKNRPVQYVAGKTWFYGLEIGVAEGVLIPRPETEELVDWVVKKEFNAAVFLDIGTGSGCIPLSIKKSIPNAKVYGADISEVALNIARKNAQNLNLAVNFIDLDILTATAPFEDENLEVIISNPPYIPVEDKKQMALNVLDFEPGLALFVPNESPLIFYEAIADYGVRNLVKNGRLYFEIHESFGAETIAMLKQKGYQNIELQQDLQGKDRMIRAQI